MLRSGYFRRPVSALLLLSAFYVATALLAGAATVAPASAQKATPKAADPLVTLNKLFRSEYAAARKALLAGAEPIIVVQFDELVLYSGGKRKRENFTPAIYHELKAVAHLPLTLYVTLARHADNTLPGATAAILRDLRGRAVAAEKSLAGRPGWTDEMLETNRKIVTASLALIDAALTDGKIAAKDLTDYTRRMRPLVLANADGAARAQLDGLHALVVKWRAELGAEAWRRAYVIVMAPRQARPGSLQYAYFKRAMGWRAEGKRLFYAENVFSATGAARLLGTILLDRGASMAFFDTPLRLERDLLADAAAIHVRRLLPSAGPPAPSRSPKK